MPKIASSSPVLDVTGAPSAGRVVRAYRRDTGALLVQGVTSDGTARSETKSWTPTGANSGWSGYTLRMALSYRPVFPSTKVRIRFTGATSAVGITLGKLYVGARATGSAFLSTPTQVFFGGSPSTTIDPSTTILSDEINFDLSGDLLISMYFSGATTLPTGADAAWTTYWRSGDFAADVAPSGMTGGSGYGATGAVFSAPAISVGSYELFTTYAGECNVLCLDPTGEYADKVLRTTPV